jgi:hypothetical protein
MSAFAGKQKTASPFGQYGKTAGDEMAGGREALANATREIHRNGQSDPVNGEAYLRRSVGRKGRERRAKVGAPPLACNVWLEDEIARLGEDAGPPYSHLYEEWLGRYYALRGYYPADPRRSFRAAVASCVNRLRR